MTREEFKQALNRYVLYKRKEDEARNALNQIMAECHNLENQLADMVVPKETPFSNMVVAEEVFAEAIGHQPKPAVEEPKDDHQGESSEETEEHQEPQPEEKPADEPEAKAEAPKRGNRKPVKMYNYYTREEKTFDTMTDAALFLNTNPQSLSTLLKTRARIGDWVVEKEKK